MLETWFLILLCRNCSKAIDIPVLICVAPHEEICLIVEVMCSMFFLLTLTRGRILWAEELNKTREILSFSLRSSTRQRRVCRTSSIFLPPIEPDLSITQMRSTLGRVAMPYLVSPSEVLSVIWAGMSWVSLLESLMPFVMEEIERVMFFSMS